MKLGIIGSGMVGSTAAYAVVMRKAAGEIVLVDANKDRAIAEAADIIHAVPFSHETDVYAGNYDDLKDCNVIVIAAGATQKPGETRLSLMERNVKILDGILSKTSVVAPDAVYLVATNPVDIITNTCVILGEKYGINRYKIIGTGTTLDTARFRVLLGKFLGVDSRNVHGYVVGEHGDSEVLTWSNVDIGGVKLEDFIAFRGIEFNEEIRNKIDNDVRNAAYTIISGKGSTYYGIGAAIAKIVDIINRDNRAVLTVSSFNEDVEGVKNLSIALPHLVGGNGIIAALPLNLSVKEKILLKQSAQIIKEKIEAYNVE